MIRKISIRDLRPGMYVAGVTPSPLLDASRVYMQEGYVRSEDEVLSIVRKGFEEVFVDVRVVISHEGDNLTNALEHEMVARATPKERSTIPLQDEIVQARMIYAKALDVVKTLYTDVAKGHPVDVGAAQGLVDTMAESSQRNSDALHSLIRIERRGAPLVVHAVGVAVLATAFGCHLGLDRSVVLELGLAGLLHDIGMTRLPIGLLNKRDVYTAVERAEMQKHSEESAQLLLRQGNVSSAVIRGVREHHERYDGSGYPCGHMGNSIGLYGQILSLADRFDALTSPRVARDAVSPAKASSIIFQESGTSFEPEHAARFIRFVGIYPTGSLVRLSDGKVGMVWANDPANPLAPLVNVVLDEHLKPQVAETLDLSQGGKSMPMGVMDALHYSDIAIEPSELLGFLLQ